MAEVVGEYYYKITGDGKLLLTELEKVEKKGSDVGNNLKSVLGGALKSLAGFFAIGQVFNFLRDSVGAFVEKAKSMSALDSALKTVGMRASDVEDAIKGMARTNAVEEDTISRVIAYGIAVGVSKDRLIEYAQATIDFSAQTGKDVESAMRRVSTEAQKATESWSSFKDGVKGAGQAVADSDGGFKRGALALRELKEALGQLMTETGKSAIEGYSDVLTRLAEAIQKLADAQKKYNALPPLSKMSERLDQQSNTWWMFGGKPDSEITLDNASFLGQKNIQALRDAGVVKTKKRLDQSTYEVVDLEALRLKASLEEQSIAREQKKNELKTEGIRLSDAEIEAQKKLRKLHEDVRNEIEKQYEASKKNNQAYLDLLGSVTNLIPGGAGADAFRGIASGVNDVMKAIEKVDWKKLGDMGSMTTGEGFASFGLSGMVSQWTMGISVALALNDALSSVIRSAMEADNAFAKRAVIEQYNALLDQMDEKLKAVNISLEKIKFNAEKEGAIRNKTVKDVDREIEAKQKLIKANEKYIEAGKDMGTDLTKTEVDSQITAWSRQITNLKEDNAKMNSDITRDWWGWLFGVNQFREAIIGQNEQTVASLEYQIDLLKKQYEISSTSNQMEVDNIQLLNDIEDLQKERLQVEQQITAEKQAQLESMQELIDKYIQIGKFDAENYKDIKTIANMMRSTGVDEMSVALGLQKVGVTGSQIGKVVNIQTLQMPITNGNNNNIGVNGFLGNQTGGE